MTDERTKALPRLTADAIVALEETIEADDALGGDVATPLSMLLEWYKEARASAPAPEEEVQRLVDAMEYLIAECDEDMDDDYNPHAAPIARATKALAPFQKRQP